MRSAALHDPRGSTTAGVAVTTADGPEGEARVTVPLSGIDLEALERALIVFALEQTAGNRTRAARFLRLTRSALLYRMHKYGLVTSDPTTRSWAPEQAPSDARATSSSDSSH